MEGAIPVRLLTSLIMQKSRRVGPNWNGAEVSGQKSTTNQQIIEKKTD